MAISEGLGTALAGLASGIASLGSGVVSGAWNASSNKRAYHFQRDLMELQAELNYNYSKQYNEWAARWNMQNAPTLTRQGLESAGYNPLLAINGGAGLGSGLFNATSLTSGGSAPQANSLNVDLAGDLANAYSVLVNQRKLANAQVDNLNATTDNTRAKTVSEGYNQDLIRSQIALNQINHALSSKDLAWKDRMYIMHEKTGYIHALANQLGSQAQAMNASTAYKSYLLDQDIKQVQNYKTRVENQYFGRDRVGHFNHSLRNAFRILHGR